jgi:7,8-dihydropterin-6-yl-methyl-4-(beta-D-ribofuranosyl)aminobenzene 5'-phosphate synthase
MPTGAFTREKGYSVYWAVSGVARPFTTAAFLRQRKQADREWEKIRPHRLQDLGTVSHLSILPLVEYYASAENLATEAGVSYLVTADEKRILFDVGRNVRQEHPSPLLRNMETLGVSVSDVDAVFISHNHLDHVGGVEQMHRAVFSLSAAAGGSAGPASAGQPVGHIGPVGAAGAADPVDLAGISAWVPTEMTHPSARVEVVTEPRKLGEGLASTGPITRAIWLMGPIAEHSLLVNVEGKGLVMIVGCGHPSLPRLIERAQTVTGVPLYGAVGGLHFPVTGSRVGKGGQNILGNGKLPWQRITRDEAKEAAARLAGLDLGLVALSGHDICDWSLGVFANTLGDRCRTVKVGEEILVA